MRFNFVFAPVKYMFNRQRNACRKSLILRHKNDYKLHCREGGPLVMFCVCETDVNTLLIRWQNAICVTPPKRLIIGNVKIEVFYGMILR